MLLFIPVSGSGLLPKLYFNTSHVTVYLNLVTLVALEYYNFNTSHVTVYLSDQRQAIETEKFQYISCYCLSLQEKIETTTEKNFNTSHVTVYH